MPKVWTDSRYRLGLTVSKSKEDAASFGRRKVRWPNNLLEQTAHANTPFRGIRSSPREAAAELGHSATEGVPHVEQPRVYRPRRCKGWRFLAYGVLGLAFGVGQIPSSGGFACCLGSLGAFLALLAAAHLLTRVKVGAAGVSKRPRVPDGFTVRWAAVESWSVVDLPSEDVADTFSHRAVRFVVGGRLLEVRDEDVQWPGFEAFLADVRACARGSEVAAPGTSPPEKKRGRSSFRPP